MFSQKIHNYDELNELFEYSIISQKEYDRQLSILLSPCEINNVDDHVGHNMDVDICNVNCNEIEESTINNDYDNDGSDKKYEDYEDYEYDSQGNKLLVKYLYKKNEDGKDVLVVRKIMQTNISHCVLSRVLKRRQIVKFGKCAGKPPGPEEGITCLGDLVYLELAGEKENNPNGNNSVKQPPNQSTSQSTNQQNNRDKKPHLKSSVSSVSTIVCRNCKEPGHWTKDCKISVIAIPDIDFGNKQYSSGSESKSGSPSLSVASSSSTGTTGGKYVPPSRRGHNQSSQHNQYNQHNQQHSFKSEHNNNDNNSGNIRIGNLDEDANEDDLRDLFHTFGEIKRINVVKDRRTNQSRGFAYVEFYSPKDADEAVEKLHGRPYGNQVLNVCISYPKPF